MLSIDVNLHPYGDSRLKKTLHTVVIVNTGEGTPEMGEYKAKIYTFPEGDGEVEMVYARLGGFDRSRGALALLYEILNIFEESEAGCPKLAGHTEEQITHSMKP